MPGYDNGPNVARYQAKRLSEGKCRTCGTRDRMVGKSGRKSPYCEIHRARATQREIARQAKLRAAGESRPSPASKTWAMHLAHPYDAQFTACGAIRDGINTIHYAGVTCGNCRRTSASRIAAQSGPPAQSGGPDGGPPPHIVAVAPITDAEARRMMALAQRRCAECRRPLSDERVVAGIEFCRDCQPAIC